MNSARQIFRRIAAAGLGDGLNAYAHSAAWFDNHLYIGITRANLAMLKVHNPPDLLVWPVRTPRDLYDLDMRAQIWRYGPTADRWERMFQAPLVAPRIPRDIGYRGMAVFQGPHDSAPALYVNTWSPSRARTPPTLMRSADGRGFEVLPHLSTDPTLNTFRVLAQYRDMLVTSPTGRVHGNQNTSGSAVVLVNRDPGRLPWQTASRPGFGDPANLTVFEMTEFAGWLYAGTLNPETGFQIWKSRLEGPQPAWFLVMDSGAQRGRTNECALSMCPFGDALYVGTGIQNGGYDRAHDVGPAAAELIRIYPDNSWDLLVGAPRMTAHGFKRPLSGKGAGFDEFFNGYIWRMAVQDGWLYAGTYKWGVFLPYLPTDRWPSPLQTQVRLQGIERLTRAHSGFDLWRTRDGINWVAVTVDGFGNPYNLGVRTLVPSPYGIFVGTANPFGPEIATRAPDGWHYTPNPKGGLEVWLGRPLDAPVRHAPARRPMLPGYDLAMTNPLADAFYGASGFYNFGLWTPETRTARTACEALVNAVMEGVPRRGRLLDVACGLGGGTEYLSRTAPELAITGIDVSPARLQLCRLRAPAASFLEMDATELAFPSGFFDVVLCLEAAFHFSSRARFLQEACRVLVPGGRLAMSDILFAAGPPGQAELPLRPADYHQLCRAAGFVAVQIRDVTSATVQPFAENLAAFLGAQVRRGVLAPRAFAMRIAALRTMQRSIGSYVLISAQRPAGRGG